MSRKILRRAFPSRGYKISDLAERYNFVIERVGNLNESKASECLKKHDVDLGIVVGTRILKESIFAVPKLGCINLHKGKVPEYRGMPPGFWELYDGAKTAGATVHFVDKGLDTGDVVAASEIPIRATETPETLLQKLHVLGASVLADAVSAIQAGTAVRLPQSRNLGKARSKPTFAQIRELQQKLPHWKSATDLSRLLKNLYYLAVYYSGLYSLVRAYHTLQPNRAAVLLYHRVNDVSQDALTIDTDTFAAQLIAISRRYNPVSTTEVVESIHQGKRIKPTSVAIHFDDCYRDVSANALPILQAAEFPAAVFISSGFVDTNRTFAHDAQKYPFSYENLRIEDIQEWQRHGFEIGAHTVNHVDLGSCSAEEAVFEIHESRHQIEEVTKETVKYFAYPFGRRHNVAAGTAQIVRDAGYQAMFSAYGGFVRANTNVFDIPRLCAFRSPLQVVLQIEGLTPGQILTSLQKMASVLYRGRQERSHAESISASEVQQ